MLALASDNDWADVVASMFGFAATSYSELPKATQQNIKGNYEHGTVITRVDNDRPFFAAGLRPLDIITEANGILISTQDDLSAVLRDRPGQLQIVAKRQTDDDQSTTIQTSVDLTTELDVLIDPPGPEGTTGTIAQPIWSHKSAGVFRGRQGG